MSREVSGQARHMWGGQAPRSCLQNASLVTLRHSTVAPRTTPALLHSPLVLSHPHMARPRDLGCCANAVPSGLMSRTVNAGLTMLASQ